MISVIIPTCGRDQMLTRLLERLAAQWHSNSGEVIVVDNLGSDDTRRGVERFAGTIPVRYIAEKRRGVAFVRNTGVARANFALLAFLDDDVVPAADWLDSVLRLAESHPDVAMFGGPVLPVDSAMHPADVPESDFAAVGAIRYEVVERPVDVASNCGLISGNLVVRREVFEYVGGFHTALQRVADGIGSVEDHEFIARATRAGFRGLYTSKVAAQTIVPPERLTEQYALRWKRGHGRYSAFLDYLFATQKDPRATTRNPAKVLLPLWLIPAVIKTTGESVHKRKRTVAHLRGYLQGVCGLAASRTLRRALTSSAPAFPTSSMMNSANSDTHEPLSSTWNRTHALELK